MSEVQLPADFVLGVATSAYQIEGAWNEDGKGPSIWDTFTQTPGRTAGDVPGNAGAGHYHRWREDVAAMKELGLTSYRFSISWSRVLPHGIGEVNELGIRFYSDLIDGLLEAGIEPNVTLYHWDLPQALQDRGGWANREVIEWFAEYARLAYDRFGDRVTRWGTLNEPIALWVGYGLGVFAPGVSDPKTGKQVMHHAMVAHGRAVREFRASGAIGEIGISIDIWKRYPATDSPEDLAIAERDEDDSFRFFFDELFRGGWSNRLRNRLETAGLLPDVRDGDFELASSPIDFLGMNLYSRVVVSAENYNPAWWDAAGNDTIPGGNYLTNGQELYPQALPDAVHLLREEYGVSLPLYVTENGYSDAADAVVDGRVADPERIRYVSAFLREAANTRLGIRGYYLWSLIDNYEWAAAYNERFGIIHVDMESMNRTCKDSAYWYREVCRTRVVPEVESPVSH